MWARFVLIGIQLFGKTFSNVWKETGKRAAQRGVTDHAPSANITIKESYQILGLTPDKVTSENIAKQFNYLYNANEKGGSVYLQAKVANAKARLDKAIVKDELIR